MPRYLSQSRVTKQRPSLGDLRRTSSSTLSALRRSKSASQTQLLTKAVDGDVDEAEDDFASLASVAPVVQTFNPASLSDVTSAMQYTTKKMFSMLPERAGMNSTRIAEVLNFQKNLPPIVSISHVHAIISASSKTEREIQTLLASGTLLKLKISGRGNDISGLSEVLIIKDDYQKLLDASGLSTEVVNTFVDTISSNSRASSISTTSLPPSARTQLIQSGFLVSSSLLGSRNLALSGSSLTGVPSISRAASGTSAAIGGEAAFEHLGGVGVGQRPRLETNLSETTSELVLSVPNIGIFLRLLDAGRRHLLDLLRISKYRQAPLYLLRERWNGAVDSDSRVSQAKKIRGDFSLILPAKTKKWKNLQGLDFDWALEECLGAGMIELFETYSVGLGVRSLV